MNPGFTAISGLIPINAQFISQFSTINHPTAVPNDGRLNGFQIFFPIIRSHVLGPIRRPLTASFDTNICKVFKTGIKRKQGETPTSRSLRKLPKSGTHAKPSLRRVVFLLVPKTADGRIACIFREKEDPLSLKKRKNGYCIILVFISHFLAFLNLWKRSLVHVLSCSDLNQFN